MAQVAWFSGVDQTDGYFVCHFVEFSLFFLVGIVYYSPLVSLTVLVTVPSFLPG